MRMIPEHENMASDMTGGLIDTSMCRWILECGWFSGKVEACDLLRRRMIDMCRLQYVFIC